MPNARGGFSPRTRDFYFCNFLPYIHAHIELPTPGALAVFHFSFLPRIHACPHRNFSAFNFKSEAPFEVYFSRELGRMARL